VRTRAVIFQQPDFILHYPAPQAGSQLDLPSFHAFAKQHRYPRPSKLVGTLAKLDRPCPQASQDLVKVYQSEAQTLARMLLEAIRNSPILSTRTVWRFSRTFFALLKFENRKKFENLPSYCKVILF
jgi:hypothetical protein